MAKLEELKAIAKAVNRNTIKNIQIIGSNSNSVTIFDDLYQALLDDKFSSDEEYCEYIYGKKGSIKAFYKLKDRLQERLINTLFFIKTNDVGFSPIQKAYYKCYKNASAIKILAGRTLTFASLSLAEKTIKKSLKFNFTEITLQIARTLSNYYGSININRKKYQYYSQILDNNEEIYYYELKAERYYTKTIHDYFHFSERKKYLDTIKEFCDTLYPLLKSIHSYNFTFSTYNILTIYDELTQNYDALLKHSQEAINYIREKPYLATNAFLLIFFQRQTLAYLMLKKYKKAEKLSEEALKLSSPSSLNWIISLTYYFRVLLHSRQFSKAKETFDLAKFHEKFIQRYVNTNELWKIHEAFIHYLIRIGKIKEEPSNKKLKPFRLGKFLNEVPVYSKDKRGSNITILILQILFLLEDKKYDIIIDRAESLQSYSQRYLKDDETYRSNCFIKMLLCLPAVGFQKDKVLKKARKYTDLLYAVPLEKAKQSPEVEVMPYEMLWEFVIDSLSRHQK